MITVGWLIFIAFALLSLANASETKKIPYITDM